VGIVQGHIQKLFDVCGSFEVLTIDESMGDFKINRSPMHVGETGISHCINVKNRTCTCGKWQDHEFPCINALAYFRNNEGKILREIVETKVSPLYNCMTLYLLWKTNINLVIISTLENDPNVLPPTLDDTQKRQPGRPVKKRFQPRSKFPNPKDSTITCKKCNQPGQNSKTCEIRKIIEEKKKQLEA
jgi:hypothetical protein